MLGIQGVSMNPYTALTQLAYTSNTYVEVDPTAASSAKSSGSTLGVVSGSGGASRMAQDIVNNGVRQITELNQAISARFDILG